MGREQYLSPAIRDTLLYDITSDQLPSLTYMNDIVVFRLARLKVKAG